MDAAPKRRWYQFSLRTLLVLMLVAGCGLGWFAHHLRLARNRQAAIEECSNAGIYVYQYEPTSFGSALRRWPRLNTWVQARFGDSLLSTPSAVSAFSIPKDRVEYLSARLRLFPSLKVLHLGDADQETVGTIRKEFSQVDVVVGFYQ